MHLQFDLWATRRTLESVRALTPEQLSRDLATSYRSVHETLVHIYQAHQIWFARLMGAPTGSLSAFQANRDFEIFQNDWLSLLNRYITWAEGLDDAGWSSSIAYRNTKAESCEQCVWQIVLHVVNHASYHRGQIAAMLRQLGHTPAGTDLINYYRSLSGAIV